MNPDLSSESNDWYTPPKLVESFRRVMGTIELDPCSNAVAQIYIKAAAWCGPGSPNRGDGLGLAPWLSMWPESSPVGVLLNPPGGKIGRESSAQVWLREYVDHFHNGYIRELCFVGFNPEWVRRSEDELGSAVLCIPRERLRFWHVVDGKLVESKQPTKWNTLAYWGPNKDRFREEMKEWGPCYVQL